MSSSNMRWKDQRTGSSVRLRAHLAVPFDTYAPEDSTWTTEVKDCLESRSYDVDISKDTHGGRMAFGVRTNRFLEEQSAVGQADLVVALLLRSDTDVGMTICLAHMSLKPSIVIGEHAEGFEHYGIREPVCVIQTSAISEMRVKLLEALDSMKGQVIIERFLRDMPAAVGTRLKQYRAQHRWTPKQAAERLNVSTSTYMYAEEGLLRIFPPGLLYRAADVYDVSVHEMVRRSEVAELPDGEMVDEVLHEHYPDMTYREVVEFLRDRESRAGSDADLVRPSTKAQVARELEAWHRLRGEARADSSRGTDERAG